MSGGPVAIRGYLVQTLVALLDALGDQTWVSVTLEPDHLSEKIDILWQYKDRTKAVQVKSSENQISVADAKRWAEEFRVAHADADELELVLVGPCSQAVAELGRLDGVTVPAPKNLDLDAFIEQAAQRLGRFLESQTLPSGSADYREMLAGALVEMLARLSARGYPFTRIELVERLKRWICQETALFPVFECPPQNTWFTGRDKEIAAVRERLCQVGRAGLGHTQGISGLGGIGKSQTAIEYAHRYRGHYDAVFWINAASDLDLTTGYRGVAKVLRLPHDANDPDSVLAAVKRWLEGVDSHCWLLVFDNVDRPPLLKPYLPSMAPNGHILVTSRMRLDVLGIRSPLSIKELPVEDSTRFLLDRADRASCDEVERQAAQELARELDGLPLALEQAAAYATAMRVTYGQYLERYRTQKLGLLERLGPVTGDYPATVATTWLINFEQVEGASKAAADLLRLSAMLDPDRIPFELLTKGAKELGQALYEAIKPSDPFSVNEVLEPLARFSLVGIDVEGQTYSIHRLVQEVVKDAMRGEGRRLWAERAVRAASAAFPSVEVGSWPVCERLLPQAMAGSRLIEEFRFQSEEAARLMNQAGYYLKARGQFGLAEPLYRQSMEIDRQVLGEQHPAFATSLNNLALLYDSMGRYEEAEPLYRQSMEIDRQVLGEKHPKFATSVDNLALLYDSMGRYKEAEPLHHQSMGIRRQVLGEKHPDFATSVNNLAGLYYSMGRYDEAEPLYRQALEIRREVLGEQQPQFAESLNNLALLYCSTGRYHEAEPLYRQSMDIDRQVLGEQHPGFAIDLNNLAMLYRATGRHEDAELLYRQALEIKRQVLGEEHPSFANSLNNLAFLYASMGRYKEAESLYRQALETRRQILGEHHPDFATSLHNLGELYRTVGRYMEAKPLYRQAVEILLKVLGPQHPDTKTVQANYDALRRELESSRGGDAGGQPSGLRVL